MNHDNHLPDKSVTGKRKEENHLGVKTSSEVKGLRYAKSSLSDDS